MTGYLYTHMSEIAEGQRSAAGPQTRQWSSSLYVYVRYTAGPCVQVTY